MSFKRAKVVMLSTKEKASITMSLMNILIINGSHPDNNQYQNQHLYIISEDEIKEGDWCYDTFNKVIFQNKSVGTPGASKKIIATTDSSLNISNKHLFCKHCKNLHSSNDGLYCDVCRKTNNPFLKDLGILLPQPSQSFIEKYIKEYNKGNIITNVLVEYEYQYHSSKEFYGKNASWVSCDKKQYNHIKETIPTCPVRETLKVNSKDNTVTIKKLKDSWNRDEVIKLIKSAVYLKQNAWKIKELDKWIEENL